MPNWVFTTLDVALRIAGFCALLLPFLWIIAPKGVEHFLIKVRNLRLHEQAKDLASYKGDVSVATQVRIQMFQRRLAAHHQIKQAVAGIERAVLEVYLAQYAMRTENHPNDLENNLRREAHVGYANNRALRLLRDFRRLYHDVAGDIGPASVAACDKTATELTIYLEAATRDISLVDPALEEQRHAGDVLRDALAEDMQTEAAKLAG